MRGTKLTICTKVIGLSLLYTLPFCRLRCESKEEILSFDLICQASTRHTLCVLGELVFENSITTRPDLRQSTHPSSKHDVPAWWGGGVLKAFYGNLGRTTCIHFQPVLEVNNQSIRKCISITYIHYRCYLSISFSCYLRV